MLVLLCALAFALPATRASAQGIPSVVIAGFSDDFADGSPGPGWSYLWNANGILGDSASYEELQWIGASQYAAPAGIPSVTGFSWGRIKVNLVHPGPGTQAGETADRYAIARYTAADNGTYFLVDSSATLLDSSCSDGVEIVVIRNDAPIANAVAAGGDRQTFDVSLGPLSAGDTVDVAVGPNGNTDCDTSVIDWDIAFVPAGIPGSEVTYTFESVPSGLKIDFNGMRQATPFGVLLPVGSNLNISARNQGLYAFDSWSIGGELSQQISVGNSDQTLTATYLDLLTTGGSIVAGYSDDWSNGPTPAAGWAYLWNSTDVLGNAAEYSPLQWNGAQYASDDISGLPYAFRFSWGSVVTSDLVNPGLGVQQGESSDRYAITRYSVAEPGAYYLVNSAATVISDTCSNGIEIIVLGNDAPMWTVIGQPGLREAFDVTLGELAGGESVDVAIGPNGDATCDTSAVDWEVFRAPAAGPNTPPALDPIFDQYVVEGESLTVSLNATDADGDGMVLSQTGLPGFGTLADTGDGTGAIVLSPAPGDAGAYAIEAFVDDDGTPSLGDSETFTVNVNPPSTLFFQQDDSGLLVMEAEHFDLNVGGNGVGPWVVISETTAFNGQALKAPTGVFTNAPDTSRAEYRAKFVVSGVHYLWVRMRGFDAGSDAAYVELDNLGAQKVWTRNDGDWEWRRLDINLGITPGVHVIKLHRRESTMEVDRILVTSNASFTPTGQGPAESPRAPAGDNVPPPPNLPPVISGAPASQTVTEQAYSFTPSAYDPEGNPMSFGIQGRPSWATFNSSTGRLQGTPGAGDVGVYNNIVITVTDGPNSAQLPAFSIEVVASASGGFTVTWNPPLTNTDGSTLIDLVGYRVYRGTQPGQYSETVEINNPGQTSHVFDQLPLGTTHYLIVTSIDASGNESAPSQEVSVTL